MLSEHNPIAELVHQIQQKWTEEASPFPDIKFIRWLIKTEEARLFEGFLKLESTEHGAIPEILVTMLIPFTSEYTYSAGLIKEWCKAYKEDHKTREKLTGKGVATSWDYESFEQQANYKNSNADDLLLKMLSSFHKQNVDKSMRLIVALFPHSIQDTEAFKRWMINLLKHDIPKEISFMIFDHIGAYYYDSLFQKYPGVTKTIHINLDLDGAISKITKMGDPNSPEVKLRECILEMGQALQKNNQPRLHEWGEKALVVTQRSGLKSMFATAHIIYAGMLFNFKQFDKIDALLVKGLSIAKQGLQQGDASCKPLLIQFYGYTAASKQLQKKMPESISAYEKQGDLAVEYQLPGMALTPYYQAYTLSKKSGPDKYEALLKKAYTTRGTMEKEELQNSNFISIAYDYTRWLESRQLWDEATQTDNDAKELFGADWKEQAKHKGTNFTVNTKNLVPVN